MDVNPFPLFSGALEIRTSCSLSVWLFMCLKDVWTFCILTVYFIEKNKGEEQQLFSLRSPTPLKFCAGGCVF